MTNENLFVKVKTQIKVAVPFVGFIKNPTNGDVKAKERSVP